MIGIEPGDILFLGEAKRRGLGEIDIAKIDVDGEIEARGDFLKPATFIESRCFWSVANRGATLPLSTPMVIEQKCIKCGSHFSRSGLVQPGLTHGLSRQKAV